MRRKTRAVLTMILILSASGACKSSPSVSEVRSQLERQIPGAEFEKEFHLSLGRFRLGLTKGLAGWAVADDEELSGLLKAVKRVDVGSYRVVALPPLEDVEPPQKLMSRLGASGWSLVVGVQDEGERVWMFLRQDKGGGIRNICVVALDEVELTMVSIEGRLDELLADAIAADPLAFVSGMAS